MKKISRFVIALSLISVSYAKAATYCDFNIRADCPPPIADAEFPAEEMKSACLKDMASIANELDELKQAILSSCVNYARIRFERAHGRNAE